MPIIQELLISVSSNLVDEDWHSPLPFKHFRYYFLLFGSNSHKFWKKTKIYHVVAFSILTLLCFRQNAAWFAEWREKSPPSSHFHFSLGAQGDVRNAIKWHFLRWYAGHMVVRSISLAPQLMGFLWYTCAHRVYGSFPKLPFREGENLPVQHDVLLCLGRDIT